MYFKTGHSDSLRAGSSNQNRQLTRRLYWPQRLIIDMRTYHNGFGCDYFRQNSIFFRKLNWALDHLLEMTWMRFINVTDDTKTMQMQKWNGPKVTELYWQRTKENIKYSLAFKPLQSHLRQNTLLKEAIKWYSWN